MTVTNNRPAALDLLRALRQLRHIHWNNRTFAGLKPSELTLLYRIRRCGQTQGLKVMEISAMLRVTSPSVTQLVNAMEARELLERAKDPSDGRIVRIKLTPEGERISLMAEQAMLTGLEGALDHLGDERSRLLVEILDELFHYFEARSAVMPSNSPDLAAETDEK